MNIQNQADVERALHHITETIDALVAEGLENGSIAPDIVAVAHSQVNPFEYGETGIGSYSAQTSYVPKQLWWKAYPFVGSQLVVREEFAEALQVLGRLFPAMDVRPLLDVFVRSYVQKSVESQDKSTRQSDRDYLTALLLTHLKGGPFIYRITAQLIGLVILTKPIDIEVDSIASTLRQPTPDDLSGEELPFGFPHWVYVFKGNGRRGAEC